MDYLINLEKIDIVELGTSRSFVDGRFEGCNSDDSKYWEPNNPEKWDWSAGHFTGVFSEILYDKNLHLQTVDLMKNHINRCKIMTNDYKQKITYHVSDSVKFLNNQKENGFDLIYMDTGDMTPIEPSAQLHLREAKIIVSKNLLKKGGLILIDDVRNILPKKFGETSDYGKAKYSIQYFIENGFEIVQDHYQVVMRKK